MSWCAGGLGKTFIILTYSRRCLSTYFHRCISQVPPFGAFSWQKHKMAYFSCRWQIFCFFFSPTTKMELKQWITQWIISCLFSYWAQQQAFAKIVPVTGELVVSHTECCIFTLRNIKIRERVLGCLVFVFLDEVPNRTCCVVGVILFR